MQVLYKEQRTEAKVTAVMQIGYRETHEIKTSRKEILSTADGW